MSVLCLHIPLNRLLGLTVRVTRYALGTKLWVVLFTPSPGPWWAPPLGPGGAPGPAGPSPLVAPTLGWVSIEIKTFL